MKAMTPHARVATALFAALLSGCADPLIDVQTIIGPRVLSARVEADGEPSRSDLAAGDSGQVKWLIVADEPGTLESFVRYCKARPATEGLPRCDGSVLGSARATSAVPSSLTLPVNIPSSWQTGDEWVAELVLCETGEAQLSGNVARCSDGSKTVHAFHRATIGREPTNHNPNLQDDQLTLDGEQWSMLDDEAPAGDGEGDAGAPTAADDRCSEALPTVELGRDHTIWFRLDEASNAMPADREPLDDDRRETLVFSHLSTHDGLERPFSFISDGTDGSFNVTWTLGADLDVPATGKRFDFFLIARDGRGGADWLHREACAVPPRD